MKIRRSLKHQVGAALVMTLGVMLIMVIVLLIASQFTLKSMRTVSDQSDTLEAQYVSESGLAWSKAYVQQLQTRFAGLQPTQKSVNDFLNLIAAACGGGFNTTINGGCDLPTSGTAGDTAKQAITEFFRSWENAPINDTFWRGIFTDTEHVLTLGSGQQYTIYNVYRSNGVVSRKPLFSITRLEWDTKTETIPVTGGGTQSAIVMDGFRFCYDIGYYVSRGSSTDGLRVVGQYPKSSTTSTSIKCPTSTGTTTAGGGSGSSTDPSRNYIEVDVQATVTPNSSTTTTPPITTGIDTGNIAGAVGIEKIEQTSSTVTYKMCGQTSNGNSGACGNNREYQMSYIFSGADAYSVRCRQDSANIDVTVRLTNMNTLYSCQVRSQSNSTSQNDYIYFIRDRNNELVFILGGKTAGNNTVARWESDNVDLALNNSNDFINKMIFVGDCKGVGIASNPAPGLYFAAAYETFASNGRGNGGGNSGGGSTGGTGITTGLNVPADFCTEASSAGVYTTVNQTVPAITTTVNGTPSINYEFKPLTTNADLIYQGRWIQLNRGDL